MMTRIVFIEMALLLCFLAEFEEVTSQDQDGMMKMSDILNSPIYHEGKCENSKNDCAESQQCKCLENCVLYDDCCRNVDTSLFPKSYSSMEKYMSCMKVEMSGNTTAGKTVYLISKCPKSFSDEKVTSRCHNIDLNGVIGRIPVTNKRTFMTYRNTFCAQCHGMKVDEAMMWQIYVHCKSFIDNGNSQIRLPEIMTSFMSTESCAFRYDLPDAYFDLKDNAQIYIRRCTSKVEYPYIDKCPEGYDPHVERLCRDYYLPLYIYNEVGLFRFYRNKHCLQCDNTLVNASLFNQFAITCDGPLNENDRFHPMLILLNFSALLYDSSGSITSCEENEVYISKLDKCVSLHCPENSFARNSKCVPYGQKINTFAINALFYINGTVDEIIVKERLKKSTSDIAYECGRYVSIANEKANYISLRTGSDSRTNQSCMIAIIQQEFRHQGLGYTTNDSLCLRIKLQQHVPQLTDDVIMRYIDDVASAPCDVNVSIRESSFMLTPFLKSQKETVACSSIEVYVLKPGKKTYNSDNHNTTKEIYGIGDVIVDARDVRVTPNGYFICWSVFKINYGTSVAFEDMNIYTVITHVCMGTSIASLFVTVCHYCVVPKLLTNHSIILLHLVVITLLTHSVYMVSLYLDSDTDACWTVALFLHGLFLALFTSSSLALLQITKQLRSMKNPFVKTNITGMLIRYVLNGYIASLTVVGTTALVKQIMFSNEVWYGKDACFISNPYVLLYSFALPVAASLLCNVSIFSLTMRSFCLDKSQNSPTATVNRSYFMLSLKLSTLLGVSWLVGYIAVITNNIVLVVIYEVTTALHGVMLSTGLLSNQAVINWYKAKCLCLFDPNQRTNT